MINTYLKKDNGKTTEVDLIMIHETGIYCIESKSYGGWIFGKENDMYWTQMFKNREKHKFYNPIMQNRGHIKTIGNYLDYKYKGKIYSVIVFSDRCSLKKISINSKDLILTYRKSLLGKLNREISLRDSIISEGEIFSIYESLKKFREVSDKEKRQHVGNLY